MERDWELKLKDGSRVVWSGCTAEDAARRYLDAHPEAEAVVAWRWYPRVGVSVWGGLPILEPGD